MALGDIKTFDIVYNGLVLQVDAVDNGDGTVQIVIKCITGHADINAIYWGDGDKVANEDGGLKGFDAKKDASLNMNGTGQAFDGGLKLSNAGLGTDGVNKPTYLTAGETMDAFTITADFDDLKTFGLRATSTSNPEGSIKGVDSSAEETKAPEISLADADCVIEGGKSIFTINLSNAYDYDITISYKTVGGTATDGDDYTGATGTVVIKAGQTSATVEIDTIDDPDVEGADNEHFTLQLTGATVNLDGDEASELSLAIADADGEGCIIDNDVGGGGGGGGPSTDHFFDNGHDLSYATFYFGTTGGDTRGVLNGEPVGGQNGNLPDGVYTVKINFPGGNGGDLDDYYQDIIDYLVANNPNVAATTPVLGVGIHAGLGNPATSEIFYAIDDDPNDVDVVPTPPGDLAQNNEIDATLDYALVFPG
jgi:hypothetical protein